MGKANILTPCLQDLQKAHSDKELGKREAKLLNVHLKGKRKFIQHLPSVA